jgi:hypothetical protein
MNQLTELELLDLKANLVKVHHAMRDEGITYYPDSQIIAICDLIRTNPWEWVLKINAELDVHA